MANSNRSATWHKVVGGNFGAVKVGTKWVGFDCLWCAEDAYTDQFFGDKAQRWQGPISPAIDKAMKNRDSKVSCQGAAAHRLHLDAQLAKKA